MNGFIFYRGFSPIDGAPIVGIATLKSKNEKTGNMVQTFILRADMHPMDAIKSADDESICGNCVHRGDSITVRLIDPRFPLPEWLVYTRKQLRLVRDKKTVENYGEALY